MRKKLICNKFPQQSPVTCIIWPADQPIICGLADGKVRSANPKTNKSSTIYNAASYTVALASNLSGKGFISGHADGKVVRYFFDDEGSGDSQGKIVTHSVPPFALAWSGSAIFAAGCDRRIFIYGRDGKVQQQFDYSKDVSEKEFTIAACSPSGQAVAVGSYNKVRIFTWSPRKSTWEEGSPKVIKNYYTVTAMSWKKDGSNLTIGNICGSLDQFDCCMKKKICKNIFEMNYVGPSQVIVLNKKTNDKIVLRSNYGYEIDDVKIMGNDKYLVAHTSDTLMLGDMQKNLLSEVDWKQKGIKNNIIFTNPNFCVIFGSGELFVIEYGSNEILGSVRTEHLNPYLFSIRINARKCSKSPPCKKIAYLLDPKTINLMDLISGVTIGHYCHDIIIDWLELSETAARLLFRDKKHQLFLVDGETFKASILLPFCSYVQWVPQSDVVVAQSKENICIWYNIEAIDRISTIPLKGGDIVDIERKNGRTDIVVTEGMTIIRHALDNGLIEFGTAMDDEDFERAVCFLDSLELNEETECMWKKLADRSLKSGNLLVAERSYAALGFVSKALYIAATRKMVEKDPENNEYKMHARILILEGRLKEAESVYLENNAVEEAIKMYTNLRKYEEALEVAEAKGWMDVEKLREEYQKWLSDTGQDELLGDLRAKMGDNGSAVTLYLRARVPGKAASLALSDATLSEDRDVLEQIAHSLVQAGRHEKAGDMYQRLKQLDAAMRCYRAGGAYQRALDLARSTFPSDVVRLEEEWGNHLVCLGQLDSAMHHFIEAGAYVKAVDAAIKSNQWTKAAEVLESIEDSKADEVVPYYLELAKHYARNREYARAESAFLKARAPKEAIEMYTTAGMWEQAHALASESMDPNDLTEMYLRQAEQLDKMGKLKDAERLYLTVKRTDRAMSMYKNHRQYRDIIRLVRAHNPDILEQTYFRLAQELELEGNLRQAEQYYMEAGEWKSAINMYRTRDQWEEAFRVAGDCKDQPELRKQVAFLWAKHLGSDSAVRLLNRLGLLETAIEYATEHCIFDFAFELVRGCAPEKIADVHNKYAMFLEDEGKFAEAEEEFIKSGKAREAVLMYVHNQDWAAAARVASEHDPESVNDVLLGQARIAFREKDFSLAEALLLRAQRPDMAVRAYREAGLWEDALRVAQAYLPSRVQELQEDYEEEKMRSALGLKGTQSADSVSKGSPFRHSTIRSQQDFDPSANPLLNHARQLEAHGEHLKAVEQYLKLTPELLGESESAHPLDTCEHVWVHAVNLATKFLAPDNAVKVTELVASRLTRLQRYSTAGDLLVSIDKIQEAVDVFIAGEEWAKARKIAKDLEPRLEPYVENQYKESLKVSGHAEELAGVDVISAIEMYAEQGRWEKCLATAERLYAETKSERDQQLLHKYLAAYAAALIKDARTYDALLLYKSHGTPPYTQNFNIYKRIFQEITSQRDLFNADGYTTWATLRDVLFDLNQRVVLPDSPVKVQPTVIAIFDRMLTVAHLYAIRSALLSARQSEDTDIPLEVPIPEEPYATKAEHEAVREWILAMSMDQKLEQILPKDERGAYVAALKAPGTGLKALPCVVTGFPVLRNGIAFSDPKRAANQDDWKRLQNAATIARNASCIDVCDFIRKWCGSVLG
uniref:Intraflagellar transport protein 172 homolog n=1 Tax=Schistocephalus solidus TaxID=70667 RepID=A0A0X3PJC6_SCHSO